jgi:hypothetical protein
VEKRREDEEKSETHSVLSPVSRFDKKKKKTRQDGTMGKQRRHEFQSNPESLLLFLILTAE